MPVTIEPALSIKPHVEVLRRKTAAFRRFFCANPHPPLDSHLLDILDRLVDAVEILDIKTGRKDS